MHVALMRFCNCSFICDVTGGVCRHFPGCSETTGSHQRAWAVHCVLISYIFLTAIEATWGWKVVRSGWIMCSGNICCGLGASYLQNCIFETSWWIFHHRFVLELKTSPAYCAKSLKQRRKQDTKWSSRVIFVYPCLCTLLITLCGCSDCFNYEEQKSAKKQRIMRRYCSIHLSAEPPWGAAERKHS